MATEQYSIGYEEGFQNGWNAAMDSLPAQRKPLTDMQVDGEWILVRDLDTNDVEKSRLFARAIEAAHGIYAPAELKENT